MTEERGSYEVDVARPRHSEALIEVEQQRAIAETQAALIIAKRFPRDTLAAIDRISNACARPGLAEASLYEYSRGGTNITGPSIRLAEAIAQNWGNLQFGIRELEQRDGVSTVEAFAWDIETNTRQLKVFQVAHKRHTKKGAYKLEDPRDIYEMVANQGARRMRACILGIIPGDVVEDAVRQCEHTLKTKAEVTPDRLSVLLTKFAEYGVKKAQIELRIQRRVDAITPAQMINLGKIYNSLKDGMSVPSDWFTATEQTETDKDLTDKLRKDAEQSGGPAPKRDDSGVEDPGTTPPPDKKPPEPSSLFEQLKAARPSRSADSAKAYAELHTTEAVQILNMTHKEREYLTKKWVKAFPGEPMPTCLKPAQEPSNPVDTITDKTVQAIVDLLNENEKLRIECRRLAPDGFDSYTEAQGQELLRNLQQFTMKIPSGPQPNTDPERRTRLLWQADFMGLMERHGNNIVLNELEAVDPSYRDFGGIPTDKLDEVITGIKNVLEV